MSRLQIVVSWLLIVNGAIGGVTMAVLWLHFGQVSALVVVLSLILPSTGIVSGVFYLRGKVWAGLLGLLFYAVQIIEYHSPGFNFDLQSGLSLHIHPGAIPAALATQPTIDVNAAAVFLLLLGVASIIPRRAERTTG